MPRGNPSTLVALRLPPELLAKVDAAAMAEGVDRSEMLRRLIERGLR